MYAQMPQKALYVLMLLFLAYWLQGILYPSGSIISQTCLAGVLGIELVCSIFVFFDRNKPLPVTLAFGFFLLLFLTYLLSPSTVWGTANEALGEVSTFGQMRESAVFSLMLPTSYFLFKEFHYENRLIIIFSLGLLGLSVIRFFYDQSQMMALLGKEDITNNAAYWFICALPTLPLLLKRIGGWWTLALFALCIVFILLGVKRGAILSLAVSALFSLCYYTWKKGLSTVHFFIALFIGVGIAILVGFVYENNEYLQFRLQQTGEKGIGTRDIAYEMLFRHWAIDSNPLTVLFGNGTAQSINVWGNYAHNDWLELLIDNGLLGVILYASFLSSLVFLIHHSQMEFYFRWCAYLCLFNWGAMTTYSMGYTSISNAILPFLLGLCICSTQTEDT